MSETNMKHFKAAQIAGMEVGLKDLEKINSYALAKLEPKDIFAFKVSMAGNEIDRDYEVFPRSTLVKLANLFVGKTVVKDHDHRSDNQIARIYSTELVENDLARMTKTGEVYTQLVAKCYMVKTSKNADLIAEIQAGIRKEVSLGCRVDKAICSICGTDNVKTYCEHFPGRRYNNNQLCYFSLENASDAYELSFVAVPAQPYAGTVKSYGKKPFYKADLEARKKGVETSQKNLHTREAVSSEDDARLTVNRSEDETTRLTVNHDDANEHSVENLRTREKAISTEEETRLTVNRLVEEAKRLLIDQVKKEFPRLTVNHDEDQLTQQQTCKKCGCTCKTSENASKELENELYDDESASNDADCATKEPVNTASQAHGNMPDKNLHTRNSPSSEAGERLIVNRESGKTDPEEKTCTQEETSNGAGPKSPSQQDEQLSNKNLHTREPASPESENRLTVNHDDVNEHSVENLRTRESASSDVAGRLTVNHSSNDATRLTVNREGEDAAESEKALKAKEAEVRIRALDLALSLRKRAN